MVTLCTYETWVLTNREASTGQQQLFMSEASKGESHTAFKRENKIQISNVDEP